VGLGTLQCVAPPGPGVRDPSTGDVLLTVVVTGGGNASVPFPYSAPRVVNTSVAACAANGNDAFVIRVHGANLGRSGAAQEPKVYIGDQECSQAVVASSAQLRCTVLNSEVGAFPVVGASPRARVCAVCVQCVCSVCAVCVQCVCSVCARVCAVRVQCVCSVCAVCVQCVCSVCAVCVQCACSVCAPDCHQCGAQGSDGCMALFACLLEQGGESNADDWLKAREKILESLVEHTWFLGLRCFRL
jgi:hypothetical protein